MRENRTGIVLTLSLLLAINLVAHFLPFERASLGNDDYAISVKAIGLTTSDIFRLSIRQPDRPLAFILLMNQEKFLRDNPSFGIVFILLFTSIVLIVLFFLLKALFNDLFLAALGSIVFCLLPNKLEIYHIPVYLPNSAAHLFYIISFIFMINYARGKRSIFFFISILSYSAGLFFYETGFFLPLVYMGYFYITKDRVLKKSFYFLLPAALYVLFKTTGVFGFADPSAVHFHKPALAMLPTNVLDLFHHYLGRYMARNIIYGLYNFFAIKPLWLFIVFDTALLVLISVMMRSRQVKAVNGRLLIISALSFVFLSAPILLNSFGGVGGRHLELPLIGVVIFMIWLLEKIKKFRNALYLFFIAVTLVVCQGNTWTQVIACRLNGAVYEVMKENKDKLIKADNIVIDTKSFADRIPYTWVKQDFNVLNTYYGAQAFEDWGLASMTRLTTDQPDKAVYIAAAGSPRITPDKMLEFEVLKHDAYRSAGKDKKIIPLKGAFIIDFKRVYGGDFNNGIRRPR